MNDIEKEETDKDILLRLLEYCKYVYEEEKERTNRLNNAVKVYLAFLTVILSMGVLKVFPVEQALALLKSSLSSARVHEISFALLFSASLILFILSFVFTVLVLKVWRFERLCDPERTAIESVRLQGENELLSKIVSDYVVAANRNFIINEKKAKLLSKGLFSMLTGLILFSLDVVLFQVAFLLKGGG